MSDQWDFYFANVNDVVGSLFVDLGIRDSAPDSGRPWLLWSWVYFRAPRSDGLSSSEEAPILSQIEDSLTKSVKEITEADLVGRITTAGRREFYFYGPQPNRFEEAVSSGLKSFPAYEFDAGTKEDPGWAQYLDVLYPGAEDHQRIKNRHVVEALQKSGDTLKAPRPVRHWAYFKSRQDRATFVARALNIGFKAIHESVSAEAESAFPLGVTLERTDRVDWNAINEVTLDLFRLAQDLGGDYDGWETSVEKDR